MTIQIPLEAIEIFREHLKEKGFEFEDRPHQFFLARRPGVVVNVYKTGKIVFGGKDHAEIEEIKKFVKSIGAEEIKKDSKDYPPLLLKGPRIGTDEVGKGDYFGPLVIAGVLIDDAIEEELKRLKVKDSKFLSETTIRSLAHDIRKLLGEKRYETLWISPIKYNLLHKKLGNVNKILGWAHARVIENLLGNGIECNLAIADQFGDPGYIKLYGANALQNVAKIHFSNTLRITGGVKVEVEGNINSEMYFTTVPKGESLKFQEEFKLECFNLISSFEKELRAFIELKLRDYYGDNWWNEGISEEVRKKAEKRIAQERKKGRDIKQIDALDFSHYEIIIGNSKNWREIFSKVFQDKNKTIGYLRTIKDIRDRVAHSRCDFTPEERIQLIGAISHLRNMMMGQRTLDSFGVKG
jgi:ribonuclease HIII